MNFKKKWIDMKVKDEAVEATEEQVDEEIKEEEKMGFIKKHKKGIILGGLGALAAGAAGLLIARHRSDDDYDEYDLDEEFEDDSEEVEEPES